MAQKLQRAGGVFRRLHDRVIGPPVDLSGFDVRAFRPDLVERARRTWQDRVRTEFRSIQIMTRFLEEVLGAGDPLDVYGGALELVEDEIRHTGLCAAVCEALGTPATLPDPIPLVDPPAYLASPMPERALATAISMLAVSETLSVGFVEDLLERCETPAIRAVLAATADDEQDHQEFGWSYVRESLARFPPTTLADWRHLVERTLEPHRAEIRHALADVPDARRTLDQWPEPELASLGVLSAQRQALVWERTFAERLAPRLRELGLLA